MKGIAVSRTNYKYCFKSQNNLVKQPSINPTYPNLTFKQNPCPKTLSLSSLTLKCCTNFSCPIDPQTKPPLVVVGSANADIYVEIERLPKEGETISAKNNQTFGGQTLPGGKGVNQAVCSSKLSYPTYFVGQVGDDANGKLIVDELRSSGVKVDYVRNVKAPTGNAIVMLQSDGQNSIIIVGGANMSCWPDKIGDDSLEVVKNGGIVLLQREIPDSVNIQFAKAAKRASVPVILDAGGMDAPMALKLLSVVDIFSPNESELRRITGMPTESFEQIGQAVAECHKMGAKKILVKLGAKGSALFVEGERPIQQPIISAKQVVDTTGAGDTFTTAFSVALVEGKPIKDCLRFAAAAASLCVQVKGAIPSMPDRALVIDLLSSV